MSHTSEDILHELTALDGLNDGATVVWAYVLKKQEANFDTTPLVSALTRVTDKWRMLAGRIVQDEKPGKLYIRIPMGKISKPAFKFTEVTYNETLNTPPLVETGVIPRPDEKYFYDPSTMPPSSGHYASLDHPLLSVHVSHLNDATCIGIGAPHLVLDGTGNGMIFKAISAEIAGREWTPPPLEARTLLSTTFSELANSPDLLEKPSLTFENYQNLWLSPNLPNTSQPTDLPAFIPVLHDITTKDIFLDEATVDRMVKEIKEQVKIFGSDKWVSTGDILLAWFLKASMADDKNLEAVTASVAVGFRDLLTQSYPGFKSYPHNCWASAPMPKFSSSWLHGATVAELALKHREHIEQVRSLPFIQSLARCLDDMKGAKPIVALSFEETKPTWLLSNQVVAGLTDINFGAGTQLEGFWAWSPPASLGNVGLFNKFKGGYVILATLTPPRWNSVEREVEHIKNGGSID